MGILVCGADIVGAEPVVDYEVGTLAVGATDDVDVNDAFNVAGAFVLCVELLPLRLLLPAAVLAISFKPPCTANALPCTATVLSEVDGNGADDDDDDNCLL